jgi:hypothetical protein
MDLYAYVTLTCENAADIGARISGFVDRLQAIHPNLPLRTVPLEIRTFTPVRSRINAARAAALANQYLAVRAWQQELASRFPPKALAAQITAVSLKGGRGDRG